jgi:O-antigen ligase
VKKYGSYTLTDHSHNLFIDFFAYGGFIAGISWIIFLFVMAKFLIQIYRSKRQVLNLEQNRILSIIFIDFVLISFISPNSLFLFLLAMIVAGVITRVNIDSRKIT